MGVTARVSTRDLMKAFANRAGGAYSYRFFGFAHKVTWGQGGNEIRLVQRIAGDAVSGDQAELEVTADLRGSTASDLAISTRTPKPGVITLALDRRNTTNVAGGNPAFDRRFACETSTPRQGAMILGLPMLQEQLLAIPLDNINLSIFEYKGKTRIAFTSRAEGLDGDMLDCIRNLFSIVITHITGIT